MFHHYEHVKQSGQGALPLDKGQKILLDALGFESASIDTLVERTGFASQSVASMLVMLELEGAVGYEAGGRYVRLPSESPRLTPTGTVNRSTQ